ncbi:small ubiquitin-related modifier 2-like [Lepus europaeus]|uniref:small ubiquitin-related modifier 2-like n=1 Tax=Lepus europaeus TaxID=9983 RepID=UPI002B4A7E15|nr:small ubiquitin-related modifier 2-like [Lepus europaeus]
MADKKPKEGVKTENSNDIHLQVRGQDGSVVWFKKRHTPLRKLMEAYYEQQGLSLELEDAGTLDVFQPQTGGIC